MKITPEKVINMLRYIPVRPDYENWIKVISAIGNHFDESTALSILRTRFSDEEQNETQDKLRHRLKNIKIGTLVYYAKENGYKPDYSNNFKHTDRLQSALNHKGTCNSETKISAQPEPIYCYSDDFYERSAILESSLNITENEANEILLNEIKNPEKIRLFRVSINRNVLNKNVNPKTLQKYNNFYTLTNDFKNELVSFQNLIDVISSGYSIIFSHLKVNCNGKIKRNSDSYDCSELLALDFDSGITIDEVLKMELSNRALLLYTTCSHTDQKHRFRLVFDLNLLFRNPVEYRKVVENFMNYYKFSDIVCKDVCRLWYGNNNTTIYNLVNGEVIQYVKGVKK